MSFFSELRDFSQDRKKYWLRPLVLALMLCGGLLVLICGAAIAPFIFRLF